MQTKSELRNSASQIRENIKINIISHKVLNNFVASYYYKNYKNIAIYYPFGTELDFISIFEDKTKNFFIPKVLNDSDMSFHKYTAGDELQYNKYKIPEPLTVEVNPSELEIIIIPALMVDRQGYRLGYGKGYYDKFLAKYNLKIPKIVLIPEELLCDELPYSEFDIPVNVIITQNKIIIVSEI